MKVVCDTCQRLFDAAAFRIEVDTLVVTCPACGGESRANRSHAAPRAPELPRMALQLASTAAGSNVVALRTPMGDALERARAAAMGDPFRVPEGRCPKCCASKPPEAHACPQCGLVFAQFDASSVEPAEWLKVEWVNVLKAWDEPVKHTELLQRATAEGALAQLGRLYRLRLVDSPGDPIAERGRDEVLRLATQFGSIPSSPVQSVPSQRWQIYAMFGLSLAFVIILIMLLRFVLSGL